MAVSGLGSAGHLGTLEFMRIAGEARSAVNPDIPTTTEAGMPGLSIASWYGVWGPKGLPAAVTSRLVTAIAEGVRQPEFRARIDAAGITPGYLDPAGFVEFMKMDLTRGVNLLKAANFQPE